jgi:hypothetical protein
MYIKLERISEPGKVFIIRNGIRQTAQNNMVISEQELATVEVLAGTLLYSIDETKLITVEAPPAPVTPAVTSTTKVVRASKTK